MEIVIVWIDGLLLGSEQGPQQFGTFIKSSQALSNKVIESLLDLNFKIFDWFVKLLKSKFWGLG